MDKEQIKTRIQDIIRDRKRKYDISTREQIDVLDLFAKVIDVVHVEVVINLRQTFFSWLKSKFNRDFTSQEVYTYTLDEEAMTQIVNKAASALREMNRQSSDKTGRQSEQIRELNLKLDEEESNRKKFQEENADIRKNIAASLQNILAVTRGHENESVSREANRILKTLGISAVFDSDSPDMFDVLKVENINAYRDKPCLLYKGQILLHGIHFESVKGE